MTTTLTQKQAALLEIYKELYKEELKLKSARDYALTKGEFRKHGLFVKTIDVNRAKQRYALIHHIRKSFVDYVYYPQLTEKILSTQKVVAGQPFEEHAKKTMQEARWDAQKKVDELKKVPSEVYNLGVTINKKIGDATGRASTMDDAISSLTAKLGELDETACTNVLEVFLTDIKEITTAASLTPKSNYAAQMTAGEQKNVLQTHSVTDNWVFSIFAKLAKMVRQALGLKTSSERMFERFEEKGKDLKIGLQEAKETQEEPSSPGPK